MKKVFKWGCGCLVALVVYNVVLPMLALVFILFSPEKRDNSKPGHENFVYKEAKDMISPEDALKKIPLVFPKYKDMGTEENDVAGNVFTGPIGLTTTLKFNSKPKKKTLDEIRSKWQEIEKGCYFYVPEDTSFMCKYYPKKNTMEIYREWWPLK